MVAGVSGKTRTKFLTSREKAKRQAFLDAVPTEQGVIPFLAEIPQETTTQSERTEIVVEPLGSPRHLTWLLLRDPETLDQQERSTLTFIREVQTINVTYELAQRFFTMVRQRQGDRLDTWLEECLNSGIPDLQTFADGLKREYSALRGALTFSYSNGPVEGQINKLKYVKRSMYGRGSFELLRQRFLQAA